MLGGHGTPTNYGFRARGTVQALRFRLAVKDSGLRALDSVLRAFSLKFRASGE